MPQLLSQQLVNHFADEKIKAQKGWVISIQSHREVWLTGDGSFSQAWASVFTVCAFSFS